MFEIQDPHFLIKHEYLEDSAGPGRWRGGLGVETEFEIYGKEVTGIAFGDGIEEEARAFGLFGGGPGSANRVELRYPDGTVRTAKTKEIIRDIPEHTIFNEKAGGGGGYGDPLERPVAKVLEDVKNQVVSIQSAREDYGVVVDPETMEVDQKATNRLRGKD
jgi:N-methylhydantoinase B